MSSKPDCCKLQVIIISFRNRFSSVRVYSTDNYDNLSGDKTKRRTTTEGRKKRAARDPKRILISHESSLFRWLCMPLPIQFPMQIRFEAKRRKKSSSKLHYVLAICPRYLFSVRLDCGFHSGLIAGRSDVDISRITKKSSIIIYQTQLN